MCLKSDIKNIKYIGYMIQIWPRNLEMLHVSS